MEKIVHESKYAIAKYDEEKELYTLTYLKETENMLDEDWKKLMTELLVVTDSCKPKYILDDNSDRKYFYSPEIQQWTLDLFIEKWDKNGLKKYVQILPTELIGELSAEQIVEMANVNFSDIFENTFVVSYKDAIEWLNIPQGK